MPSKRIFVEPGRYQDLTFMDVNGAGTTEEKAVRVKIDEIQINAEGGEDVVATTYATKDPQT